MVGTRPFLDEVPHYSIVDGVMHITSGDFQLAMPLRKFRLAHARAARVMAEHDAKKGNVVPLPKKRPGKH
jgi:hypothetical protein